MKNKELGFISGIVLACIMLFTACNDIVELTEDIPVIEDGYGRIAINFTGAALIQESERTILPSVNFNKFDYYFIKSGETIETKLEPDENGFFILKVGDYTVVVHAYTDDEDSNIAAIGQSLVFSVGEGLNAPVDVALSEVTSEDEGEFFYTVTYPEYADAEITLRKWTGTVLENIPLSPVLQDNSKSETLSLDNGTYILTVLVNKDYSFTGISEAVHIYPYLTTVYTKEFSNEDLLLEKFTVTYNANDATGGTVPNAQTLSKGSSITLPVQGTLLKTDHTFEGWKTEPGSSGTIYAPAESYTVLENITLYANWQIITYTVCFDIKGGSEETPSSIDVTIGSTLSTEQIPSPDDFTKEYCLNDGKWYIDEECTTEFVIGTTPVTSDITLYLNWIDQRPVIIFNTLTANGSTSATTTELTITLDRAIGELTEDDVTISGIDNVIKGTLSGSGTDYMLTIATTFNGTLNVKIEKAGFNITPSSRNVIVFGTPISFNSVTPNGSATETTTELTITFSEAITGLTEDDIDLLNNSKITKGSLSGSGTTYTLGITVTDTTGGTLNVTVRITKPELNISPISIPVAVFSYPPLTGTVSITGIAQVDSTLTAITNNLYGSGTISYQWQRGTTDITDATNSTYIVQAADRGSVIRVRVTRANTSGSITSESTNTIPPEGSYSYASFNSEISADWTTSIFTRESSGGVDNTGCLLSNIYYSGHSSSITTPYIAVGTNPVLSFKYKANFRSGGIAANNVLRYTVQISTNGTTWSNLSGYTDLSHVSNENYETITIDLSAFANQSISARIIFTWVIGDINIWLDDVAFGTVPPIFFSLPLDIGTVNYSSSNARTHLITNKGSWPLDVRVTSTSSGITVTDLTDTVTIPSFSSRTISVNINTYSTTTGYSYNGSITFATNDPDNPSYVVNVTGTWYAPNGVLGNFNSAIPAGWTTSNFSRQSSGGVDNTGCLRGNIYGSGHSSSITTSYIAVGTTPSLSFKYKATNFSGGGTAASNNVLRYTVQISKDGTTWTDLLTNVSHVYSSNFTTITPYLSSSTYSRQIVWVRIIFTWVTGDIYVYLDDVNIQ